MLYYWAEDAPLFHPWFIKLPRAKIHIHHGLRVMLKSFLLLQSPRYLKIQPDFHVAQAKHDSLNAVMSNILVSEGLTVDPWWPVDSSIFFYRKKKCSGEWWKCLCIHPQPSSRWCPKPIELKSQNGLMDILSWPTKGLIKCRNIF